MATNIYDQHRKAFHSVSAYVVMRGNERVANIAFRYPNDGAGRLWVYVHYHGTPMVRGYASGGGYDKHSAACASAAEKIDTSNAPTDQYGDKSAILRFIEVLKDDNGYHWDTRLHGAGFDVLQAV